jgi:hypothetical protein
MARGKKRPTRSAEEKHPMELTNDEALEHLFGKEGRDEAKRIARDARKADRNGEKPPHK